MAVSARVLLTLFLGAGSLLGCEQAEPVQEPLPPAREVVPTFFEIDAVDDPLATGHLLMRAGQYELALRAFTRAFARGDSRTDGDIELALGTVNARLGRLRAAERFLDRAVSKGPNSIEAWNNLGVVVMSQGDLTKARNAFQTAFALSNGTNDAARMNLARVDELDAQQEVAPDLLLSELTLVRQGSGRYLLGTPTGEGETE